MKRILTILILLGLLGTAVCLESCRSDSGNASSTDYIKTYQDIPGITEEEISAIEALKSQRDSFSYAGLVSTEVFLSSDGTYTGFMVKLCELLTSLFDVEFSAKPYSEWSELMDDLTGKAVDFAGDLTPTAERMQEYCMTHAIAERSLRLFTHEDSAGIVSESDIDSLTIGFFSGTVTAEQIKKYYPVSFESVYIGSTSDVAEMLRTGVIDAFVTDSVADVTFESYDFIRSKEFFPLVYSSVSIATANHDLDPVISVINKYLSAGGIDKLYALYKESDYEYAKYKLGKSFTKEEQAYLNDLARRGASVHIGLENDNYPISFYSEKDKEHQGIAVEVIAEIGKLTGIRFETVTTTDTPWAVIMEKLRTGEISMTAELLYSDTRKDEFIWGSVPYASSYYALISKSDYPYMANYQVIRSTVGVIEKTAYEDMYYAWFSDDGNVVKYDLWYDGLKALEKGEIDLLMASEYLLLTQTNYLEKPGYKVNIPFDAPLESFFGFNKDEKLLRSVIDKAQTFVKTDIIETSWTNRTYDYSKKLSDQRAFYLAVFVAVLSTVLVFLVFLMIKNKRLSKETADLERVEAESRRAALAAEDASRMKSIFLANMSHEIRTPMNSIVGFSELALDSNPSPAVKTFLEKIKYSSDILLNIINDILDITKIESGKITLENIPFDMHDLFSVCQTIIEPRTLEKGIRLYCYAEPSVGKKLLGDPARLRQALLNLLSNAVKFTNTGMVKLLAAIEKSTGDSVTMRFEVKDSGIGMTREQVQMIFEPFMQADESTTRRYGGTGLGLSITKSIIELMGGRLMVESVPDIGSKFSFSITFKTLDVPIDALENDIKLRNIERPVFKGEVLVCEDNQMNQEVICEHLSRVGLNVAVADNGREGVDTVLRRMESGAAPFELILMDIHMPVMDGLEAAKILSQSGSKTPVIALTANIMPEDRETYKVCGMRDYLAKPFRTDELWSCLVRHLTPVGFNAVDTSEESQIREKQYNRLMRNFVNDNQTAFENISSAIESGDVERAHRLAHTLKGVAGLVGRGRLQGASRDVERSLEDGKITVTKEQMDALKAELSASLGELERQIGGINPPPALPEAFDKQKALELLDRLDQLLESGDTDSLDLTDELMNLPGTESLIMQIERYDFEPARKTLENIKKHLY